MTPVAGCAAHTFTIAASGHSARLHETHRASLRNRPVPMLKTSGRVFSCRPTAHAVVGANASARRCSSGTRAEIAFGPNAPRDTRCAVGSFARHPAGHGRRTPLVVAAAAAPDRFDELDDAFSEGAAAEASASFSRGSRVVLAVAMMVAVTVALAAVACASEFSLRIEYPPAGSVVEIEALDHPCSGVKLGIERALERVADADVVVALADASSDVSDVPLTDVNLAHKTVITVWNKTDVLDDSQTRCLVEMENELIADGYETARVSCLTGDGVDAFVTALTRVVARKCAVDTVGSSPPDDDTDALAITRSRRERETHHHSRVRSRAPGARDATPRR